jgi:hypothetical protein
MMMMMMIIIIIIRRRRRRATYRENMKSRKYRKQPYWALHTHCGKY